jgi:hypothetical protein
MAKKTALVIVDTRWFNSSGISRFFGGTKKGDSHFIYAPLDDINHPLGVWLDEVTSNAVQRVDNKPFTMRFMIPWANVQGLAVVDGPGGRSAIGFQSDESTTVIGSQTKK